MKKLVLFPLLFVLMLFPAYAGNERLIGSWKSNKEATLAYLKTHTKLTPAQLEKLGTVLGSAVFVFDAKTVTLKNGTWKFVSKYTITEETKGTMVIESENPDTKKMEKSKLEMDTTGFWTPDEKIAGYKERFDKIVTK